MPFYLRSGKRLATRAPRRSSCSSAGAALGVPRGDGPITPNRLVLRLQPDEGVRLHLVTKEPGPGGIRLHPAELNLSFAETFKSRVPDAYERLLMDVVQGRPSLFMRRDEVETAWAWIEPILRAWDEHGRPPRPTRPARPGPPRPPR